MERDDVKRRRKEEEIVERVKQGLPLQKDALAYLINHFDLQSLNRFCSTSRTVRDFCKANQIWRKKFQRHLPRADNWLGSVTPNQWLQYWDFLSSTRCPEQYRLLVAFISIFNREAAYHYGTKDVSIRLFLDLEFEFRVREARELDEIIGFVPPTLFTCRFVQLLDSDLEEVFDVENDILRMEWQVENYSYDRSTGEVEWKACIPYDVPDDAVSIVYKLIGMKYIPEDFQFKTITAHIGSACATCNAIAPQTVCGNCEQVLYCNQQCADAHWETHHCKPHSNSPMFSRRRN